MGRFSRNRAKSKKTFRLTFIMKSHPKLFIYHLSAEDENLDHELSKISLGTLLRVPLAYVTLHCLLSLKVNKMIIK